MQDLLGRLAVEIANRAGITHGDTVDFRIRSTDDGWIAREAVMSGLTGAGVRLFSPTDSVRHAGVLVQVFSSELRVLYDEAFHDGFLGTLKVRRTVSAGIACEVTGPAGTVAYTGSPSLAVTDTVVADEVSSLELPSARVTHAELPPERFLDRVLEPLVIIGATGISIFLFFHVRS